LYSLLLYQIFVKYFQFMCVPLAYCVKHSFTTVSHVVRMNRQLFRIQQCWKAASVY